MGRMKEIFMQVYEKFDGEIPTNFDFDTYISENVKQYSICCGSDMSKAMTYDGPTFQEIGYCPDCGENC